MTEQKNDFELLERHLSFYDIDSLGQVLKIVSLELIKKTKDKFKNDSNYQVASLLNQEDKSFKYRVSEIVHKNPS